MQVKTLSQELSKLQDSVYGNLDVFIGDSVESEIVAAVVVIDDPNNYRYTHIRLAESLGQLIQDILNNYKITLDDLPQKVIPIVGFSKTDLIKAI